MPPSRTNVVELPRPPLAEISSPAVSGRVAAWLNVPGGGQCARREPQKLHDVSAVQWKIVHHLFCDDGVECGAARVDGCYSAGDRHALGQCPYLKGRVTVAC